MAVIKSLKLTPTEKRLQDLKEQFYGKNPVKNSYVKVTQTLDLVKTKTEFTGLSANNYQTDVRILRADLLKIMVLALLAFTVQFALYISVNNGILRF